ncbi:MAG: hypothetical protein U9P50_03470 [Patescibacteria group bacterium]|nr:hypothetical protein [Patescibacteria group bacterium]
MKKNFRFIERVAFTLSLLVVWSACLTVQAQDWVSVDIEIRNPVLVYEDNDISVSFDITNGEGAQSGIKYGIRLIEDGGTIDEKVYTEVLDIGEMETLSRDLKYSAPAFLRGTYGLEIVARNEAGLPVAINNVGDIVLDGTGEYLNIVNDSCYLIVGEGNGENYNIRQGVDVAPEETLVLNCRVSNLTPEKVEFEPIFETHRRSTFGEIVFVNEDNLNGTNNIESEGIEMISFVIPKPEIPQAYDTKVSLSGLNDNGEKITSNSIAIHYVVRGGSATVHNIKLDSGYYLEGDLAEVSFLWTPSADDFQDSRLGMGTKLDDVVIEGVIDGCSDRFYYTPNDNSFGLASVSVPILKRCQDPKVSLLIKSEEQILDEAILSIKNGKKDSYFLITFVVIVVLVFYGLYLFRKRRKQDDVFQQIKNTALFLVLIGTTMLLGGAKDVNAASWAGAIPNSSNGYGAFFTYSINMNSNPVPVSLQQLTSGGCNNAYLNLDDGYIEVFHDGVSVGKTMYENPTTKVRSQVSPVNTTKSTTPGTHTITLKFYANESVYDMSSYCLNSATQLMPLGSCLDEEWGFDNYPSANCDIKYEVDSGMVGMSCMCVNIKSPPPYPVCSSCSYNDIWGRPSCPSYTPTFKYIGSKDYTYTVADQTPSCTVEWDDNDGGIKTGDSSTLTWSSSSNAVSAKYSCSGVLSWNDGWGSINPNGSYPFTFDNPGTEKCVITVKNSNGVEYSCDDTLRIDPTSPPANPTCSVSWVNSSGQDVSSVKVGDSIYFKWASENANSSLKIVQPLTVNLATATGLSGDLKNVIKNYKQILLKVTAVSSSGKEYSCFDSLVINSAEELSCNLSWSNYNVVAPGSSTAIWYSSGNAVSASYACTGPITAAASGLPVSGSATLSFDVNQTGNQVCTITVADSAGKTATCGSNSTVIVSTTSCTPSSWSPSTASVCDGDDFTQTSDCGSTRGATGTKNCGGCTPSSWSPPTSSECSGDNFTQTSNCGTTRTATGTKNCGGCTPSSWSPPTSSECSGDNFTQTSNCGTTRTATGTKNCCVPTIWEPAASTTCEGTTLTQTSNCGTTREVPGVKDCPICTAAFNPTSVTSPGSSILTWSSTYASDIKYSCTGPVAGGADYGSIPLNSPASPAVVFNFPYGPAATEVCTFTVKDDSDGGEVGTCSTDAGAGNGGVVVTPHSPTCTLNSSEDIVFLGDSTTLSWTSNYTNSASINRGVGSISPLASGSVEDYPSVTETQDITYTGSFTGYGGTTNCSTDLITVVVDPPEIISGSFNVHNQRTGLKPIAEWQTQNVVRCDLESDTGYSQTNVCSSEATCASVGDYLIDKIILEETVYTLTCYHELSYEDTATFEPLAYFNLFATPTEVEADFAGGGVETEPGIDIEVISWNGYRNDVSFTADLSSLPESPGEETTNTATFTPETLSFADYFTDSLGSILKIFASYRFTGEKMITIFGNGIAPVNITITSDQTIPIYEPI